MTIAKLTITNLRNIKSLTLEPHPNLNIVLGENGSGKTAILEAIHILGSGRSFRTLNSHPLISLHQPYYSVFGIVNNQQPLGIQKMRQGEKKIQINDKLHQSASTLAQILPIIIINSDSYLLLCGEPKQRLKFIDLGVFHVEPSFLSLWKRTNIALKHRNKALKQQLPYSQLYVWTRELVACGLALDQLRKKYIHQYLALFNEVISAYFSFCIEINYQRGWQDNLSLEQALVHNLERDSKFGYTQYGPHRADLQIRAKGQLARDILSRGQQKVLVSVMRLTQGLLLKKIENKTCTYLIDDLAAELDARMRETMADLVKRLNAQIFMTGTDLWGLKPFLTQEKQKVFHVKQGQISA